MFPRDWPESLIVERVVEYARRLGWRYATEVHVPVWKGRADLLLWPDSDADGFWLVEAKRHLLQHHEARDAVTQVAGYRPFLGTNCRRVVVLAQWFSHSIDVRAIAGAHGVDVCGVRELRHEMTLTERARRAPVHADPRLPITELTMPFYGRKRETVVRLVGEPVFRDDSARCWYYDRHFDQADKAALAREGVEVEESLVHEQFRLPTAEVATVHR